MIKPTQIEAKRRIRQALERIEGAQYMIADAASDISRVVGVIENWEELHALYDTIKATWHRLNMRATDSEIDLDSDEKRKLEFQTLSNGGRK